MSTCLYGGLTVCFYHVTYAFRVNLHSEVARMSGKSLLEAGAIFEDEVATTGLELTTT